MGAGESKSAPTIPLLLMVLCRDEFVSDLAHLGYKPTLLKVLYGAK